MMKTLTNIVNDTTSRMLQKHIFIFYLKTKIRHLEFQSHLFAVDKQFGLRQEIYNVGKSYKSQMTCGHLKSIKS